MNRYMYLNIYRYEVFLIMARVIFKSYALYLNLYRSGLFLIFTWVFKILYKNTRKSFYIFIGMCEYGYYFVLAWFFSSVDMDYCLGIYIFKERQVFPAYKYPNQILFHFSHYSQNHKKGFMCNGAGRRLTGD